MAGKEVNQVGIKTPNLAPIAVHDELGCTGFGGITLEIGSLSGIIACVLFR
jgi:hypothetical protein